MSTTHPARIDGHSAEPDGISVTLVKVGVICAQNPLVLEAGAWPA